MKQARQRLSTEERQDDIVAAAIRLAENESPERITTQHMAQAIGLTQGAIFRHFPTKESIWAAVVDWMGGQLAQAVERAAAEADDPLQALERIFLAHTALIARYPAMPRILFHELQSAQDSRPKQLVRGILARYRETLVSLLRAAQGQGLARGQLDAEAAANLFIGAIQGLVMQAAIQGNYKDMPRRARRVFPLFLDGIRKCGGSDEAE